MTYFSNKHTEDQMKMDAGDKSKEEDKEGAGAKKKVKGKGKDKPTTLPFGQGTRVLFDYLKFLQAESQNDEHFISRLDIHKNPDLSNVIKEI